MNLLCGKVISENILLKFGVEVLMSSILGKIVLTTTFLDSKLLRCPWFISFIYLFFFKHKVIITFFIFSSSFCSSCSVTTLLPFALLEEPAAIFSRVML
uniref:Uncharacterized protein n=1 Tax=Arundo donax TaxID=35708 RepID=A0A0A9FGQ5_ARUDO